MLQHHLMTPLQRKTTYSCMYSVDSGRLSTEDVIVNGGVHETASPDSARPVYYDRTDAICNEGVQVDASRTLHAMSNPAA
ncbi:hypothetical protein HPB52_002189 [Rhipicephalus sanguineus]|uniref:Uncharacterized protein n=1 Tax=Rhipicephalus sanguineus TaxID=34632 RepID=A0A9D4SPP9_RHISA|nr:hypothetical protein HPB52_002189 [Rhipicephalus sanguineus]